MKRLIYSLLSVLVLFAACQKGEQSNTDILPAGDGFTASVEMFEAETKTQLSYGKNRVEWTKGDRIAIFMGKNTPEEFVLQGNSGANGKFRKPENATCEFGDDFDMNVAVYPYSDGLSVEKTGGSVTKVKGIDFPSQQTYKSGSFPEGAFVMVAATGSKDDKALDFKNVCGILRLDVIGSISVGSIEIKGNSSNDFISGNDATVDISGEAPVVGGLTGDSIILECGEVTLNRKNATEFYIAIPPTVFEKGFTVNINGTDGETHYTLNTDKAQEIKRSTMLHMNVRALGLHEDIEFTIEEVEITPTSAEFKVKNNGSTFDTWYSFVIKRGENIEEAIAAKVAEITSDGPVDGLSNSINKNVSIDDLERVTDYTFVVFGLTEGGERYGNYASWDFSTFVENPKWKLSYEGFRVFEEELRQLVTIRGVDGDRYIEAGFEETFEQSELKSIAEAVLKDALEDNEIFTNDLNVFFTIAKKSWCYVVFGVTDDGELNGYYAILDDIEYISEEYDYSSWLGDWTWTGSNGVTIDVTFSEKEAGKSYWMTGWEGRTEKDYAIPVLWDADFLSWSIPTNSFGTFDYLGRGEGELFLLGYQENSVYTYLNTICFGYRTDNEITCIGNSIEFEDGSTVDIEGMNYFMKYPDNDSYIYFTEPVPEFPITITSRPSAKSSLIQNGNKGFRAAKHCDELREVIRKSPAKDNRYKVQSVTR